MTRRPPKHESDSRETRDDSLRSALERTRVHSQLALSEGAAALGALLDAASISVTADADAARNSILAELARKLDQTSATLADASSYPGVQPLLDALDAQIERWEERSEDDPDARAVLRAFLGLREVLWETGFRPQSAPNPRPSKGDAAHRRSRRATQSGRDPVPDIE